MHILLTERIAFDLKSHKKVQAKNGLRLYMLFTSLCCFIHKIPRMEDNLKKFLQRTKCRRQLFHTEVHRRENKLIIIWLLKNL